jgi:hypothetical protein
VWRVRSNGESRVLKHIALGAGGTPTWPSEPEETSPHYWRREALVYEHGLPVSAPFRLPASASFARADGSVALWLEDAGERPGGDVPAIAARLAGMPRLDDGPAWLARPWLRRYLELRAHRIDPDVPAWRAREEILARIDAAPTVLVHNDFHPGNVFPRDGDMVVVDWAFCGLGAVGGDAGVLAADALYDRAADIDDPERFLVEVWEAYAAELDPALVEDAEYVYFAGNALRYAWSAGWDDHFAAVYRAVTSAAARLPSFP